MLGNANWDNYTAEAKVRLDNTTSTLKRRCRIACTGVQDNSLPPIRLSDFKSSYLRFAIETFDLNQLENFTSAYNKDELSLTFKVGI